eukprot:3195675-Pyramimonas_sp.AAC.1
MLAVLEHLLLAPRPEPPIHSEHLRAGGPQAIQSHAEPLAWSAPPDAYTCVVACHAIRCAHMHQVRLGRVGAAAAHSHRGARVDGV